MKTRISRAEKSSYTDQHGIEHECMKEIEACYVEKTSEFISFDYYGPQKDYIWIDETGRKFRKHCPFDFGGQAHYTREGADPVEFWRNRHYSKVVIKLDDVQ